MKIKSLNSSVELNVFPGQGTDYSLRVVDAPDGDSKMFQVEDVRSGEIFEVDAFPHYNFVRVRDDGVIPEYVKSGIESVAASYMKNNRDYFSELLFGGVPSDIGKSVKRGVRKISDSLRKPFRSSRVVKGLNAKFSKKDGFESYKDVEFYYDDEAAFFDIGGGFYTGNGTAGSDVINSYIEQLIIDGFNTEDYSEDTNGPIVPINVYMKGSATVESYKSKNWDDPNDYTDERSLIEVELDLLSAAGTDMHVVVPNEIVDDFYTLYEKELESVDLDFSEVLDDDIEYQARTKSAGNYNRDLT